MASFDPASLRLRNSRLIGEPFGSVVDAVGWFGAVQAQDLAGAKWALGQRVRGATEAAIDQALDDGAVIRTHVLRPTWHFVLPADLRWMLALTAPRVKRAMATYDRPLALDDKVYRRCNEAIIRALEDGAHLTRGELARALRRAKITADGQRLAHIAMRAELDAVICSGPRRGKQQTYALVDARCPATPQIDREAALAQLARRYFASHGPALVADFAWWSGLTLSDARRAVELVGRDLASHTVDEQTYWFAGGSAVRKARSPVVHLLPNYDESIVAYRHRALAPGPALIARLGSRPNLLFHNLVMLDGAPIGTWRRAPGIVVDVAEALPAPAQRALDAQLARFERYATTARLAAATPAATPATTVTKPARATPTQRKPRAPRKATTSRTPRSSAR